jgi:hypothetical protein
MRMRSLGIKINVSSVFALLIGLLDAGHHPVERRAGYLLWARIRPIE